MDDASSDVENKEHINWDDELFVSSRNARAGQILSLMCLTERMIFLAVCMLSVLLCSSKQDMKHRIKPLLIFLLLPLRLFRFGLWVLAST